MVIANPLILPIIQYGMVIKILGLILIMFSIVDSFWVFSDGIYVGWKIARDVVFIVVGIFFIAYRKKEK